MLVGCVARAGCAQGDIVAHPSTWDPFVNLTLRTLRNACAPAAALAALTVSVSLHAATPAIATVRSTFRYIFFSSEVSGSCSAVATFTMNFYVIYKVI
mgnify:CR=1 FL=1